MENKLLELVAGGSRLEVTTIRVVIAMRFKINTRSQRQGGNANAKTLVLVYGLQKTFAKDINGIVTSELIMLYLAFTSRMQMGTASRTLVQDDDGHDCEDSDYNTTVEMTSDGDDASNMMLPILGALPMAAEELDMEALYPILSQLLFPSDSGGLPV
jgi:hypothetical protein